MDMWWSATVGATLVLWLGASGVHQLRWRWWKRIERLDVLNLLPRWSFFAPNPGHHDVHVVYREWQSGNASGWVEIAPGSTDSSIRWFWNPDRYITKSISDLATGLLMSQQTLEPESRRAILLSAPYIGLLAWVVAQPMTSEHISARQFAIVRTQLFGPDRRVEVRFVSDVHRLSA